MRSTGWAFMLIALGLMAGACGTAEETASTTTSTTPAAPNDPADTTTSTSSETAAPTTTAGGDGCADVVAVETLRGDGGYTFSVTVASADTGWDKYADAWVVKTLDGEVVAERVLTHPHENEQPFTRSLSGVAIPAGVSEVVVAARDSVVGFCGAEMTVAVEPTP